LRRQGWRDPTDVTRIPWSRLAGDEASGNAASFKLASPASRLLQGAIYLLAGVDLVEHPAIIEVGFLHGAPVTKGFLHRQEVDFREAVGVLGQYLRITRAQVVVGGDFLAFR
jgi:hypothetical protein